jgi:hypothetical protein
MERRRSPCWPRGPIPTSSRSGSVRRGRPGGERVAFFHLTVNRATAEWSTTELAIASREGRILARLPYDEKPGPPAIRDDQRVQWSRDGRNHWRGLVDGVVRSYLACGLWRARSAAVRAPAGLSCRPQTPGVVDRDATG